MQCKYKTGLITLFVIIGLILLAVLGCLFYGLIKCIYNIMNWPWISPKWTLHQPEMDLKLILDRPENGPLTAYWTTNRPSGTYPKWTQNRLKTIWNKLRDHKQTRNVPFNMVKGHEPQNNSRWNSKKISLKNLAMNAEWTKNEPQADYAKQIQNGPLIRSW